MPGRGKKEIYLPYRYYGKLSSELKKQGNHYFPSLLKKGQNSEQEAKIMSSQKKEKKTQPKPN